MKQAEEERKKLQEWQESFNNSLAGLQPQTPKPQTPQPQTPQPQTPQPQTPNPQPQATTPPTAESSS